MEAHRFLNSEVPEPESHEFVALGHAGSDAYGGLETFDNPGCMIVAYTSDEVMAICPITKQPDFYTVTIELAKAEKLIESKSIKLYFQRLMRNSFMSDTGIFCESLAVKVREDVCEVCELEEENVRVTLVQKSRGGITIKAVA